MWKVERKSALVLIFRKIKQTDFSGPCNHSLEKDTMSALSSEINNLSELALSDFESDVIKFQSDITEVQTDLEDLLLRVRTLQGSQSDLPDSFTEDLVCMMKEVDSLNKRNSLNFGWINNHRFSMDLEGLDTKPAMLRPCNSMTSLQQIDSGLGEVEDIPPQEEDEMPQAMLRSGQGKELEEKETMVSKL